VTPDELRAALEVAELEEQLTAAKATPDGPSTELKHQVRQARHTFRTMREAAR
jgi:hypothetical protein